MADRRKIVLNTPAVEIVLDEPLHIKYRPKSLKEVLGQDAVVKSLQAAISARNPGHSYLFTGPSGTGKTTLARILAAAFKCDLNNIVEADAATNNGIDSMRELTAALRYHALGETPNRAIIIDECHALSKAAWQSLLKTVEEPPAHVFIFFCTTETGKVPETILTRCQSYTLKPLRHSDIVDVLVTALIGEDLDNPQGLPEAIIDEVAGAANGSARQALVMLAMVKHCKSAAEAAALLESPIDNKDVIDLCRLMVSGKLTWGKAMETVAAIPDMNPESVRIVVTAYLVACLKGAKSENDVLRLLDMMSCFSKPFNASDKVAPLLLALGNVVFDK